MTTATNTTGVWERVWRHEPDEVKDAFILQREEASPRWKAIHAYVARFSGKLTGLRTIELGSGRGDLSVLLAQQGANVTLLDACPAALESAERRFQRLGLKANLIHADMFHLPDELAGQYDLSLSSGVIEHFTQDQRREAVEAHACVLRPHGLTAISVPHASCPPYRVWKSYLEFRGWWPYGYEEPYTSKELLSSAELCGFSQTETHISGFWQSVGDHWGRNLLGLKTDWSRSHTRLDRTLGGTLLLLGRKLAVAKIQQPLQRYDQ